jgi:hypothetical protein
MEIGAAFVADSQATEPGQPRQHGLHDPPVPAPPSAVLDAVLGDARRDGAGAARAAHGLPGSTLRCALILITSFFGPVTSLAQSFTPFPIPPAVDTSGTAGRRGEDKSSSFRTPVPTGGNGGNGSPGNPISRELNTSVAGSGSTAVVSATSNGGAGGQGGAGIQNGLIGIVPPAVDETPSGSLCGQRRG